MTDTKVGKIMVLDTDFAGIERRVMMSLLASGENLYDAPVFTFRGRSNTADPVTRHARMYGADTRPVIDARPRKKHRLKGLRP